MEEKPVIDAEPVTRTAPPTVTPKKAPKTTSPAKRAKQGAVALFLIVTLALGFLGGWLGSASRSQNAVNNPETQKQVVATQSQLIADIAKSVGPSVVSVDVTSQSQQQSLFGYSQPVQQQSAGTGIIISTDGYIITNRHVVPAGSTSVSVTLSDGTTFNDVQIIGRTNDADPLDIAFLKIKDTKGHTLTAAKLGDSSKMRVGDMVIAIGNALGQFQNTVTSGIVSGYGRSVQAGDSSGLGGAENLQDLFQTDAAINEGNSGGPLLNVNGEVIGINTAIAGDAQNIGFAIPTNNLQGLVSSVLSSGKLQRPVLGVRYISLTDDVAYRYNLNTKRGAYLAPGTSAAPTIVPGSPAEKAGLKEKDVIVKINGVPIDETHSLVSLLGRYKVGDTVELTVVRDGKEQVIKVTLEAQS